MNDKYAIIDNIKNELEPISGFLKVYDIPPHIFKVSLNNSISFKEFQQYHPNITKKQLIKLFDFCEKNKTETRQAIKEILN